MAKENKKSKKMKNALAKPIPGEFWVVTDYENPTSEKGILVFVVSELTKGEKEKNLEEWIEKLPRGGYFDEGSLEKYNSVENTVYKVLLKDEPLHIASSHFIKKVEEKE